MESTVPPRLAEVFATQPIAQRGFRWKPADGVRKCWKARRRSSGALAQTQSNPLPPARAGGAAATERLDQVPIAHNDALLCLPHGASQGDVQLDIEWTFHLRIGHGI